MRYSLALALLAFAMSSVPVASAWGQTIRYLTDRHTVSASTVKVSMTGVDDIGGVFVLNEVALRRLQTRGVLSATHECRWSNEDGRGSWSLEGDLEEGENIIVLALYNLVYTGPSLRSSGGKWAFDFKISGDGRTLWQESNLVDNNSKGLKYIMFAKAVRRGDQVTFEPLSQDEKVVLVDIEAMVDAHYSGEQSVSVDWEPILEALAQ